MAPISRSKAVNIAVGTLEILDRGSYETPTGTRINLTARLAQARRETQSYPPDMAVAEPSIGTHDTAFEVRNETSLTAAKRLALEGYVPAVLNFASAKNPGGGFITGARAQEESLARVSGLYTCLQSQNFYEYHRTLRDPMYTNWVLYSPRVPVFREEDGTLLDEPYDVDFITCAAVNVSSALTKKVYTKPGVTRAMRNRIHRVLSIAFAEGARTLVLGAWGCGVFENDPEEIAGLFHAELHGAFKSVFDTVVFAVLDEMEGTPTLRPFQRLFGKA